MRSTANKQSKIIKILCKARDFYVKGMMNFAGSGKVGHGGIVGGGAAATYLPKSFTVNSSRVLDDEELRQLVRLYSRKESEMRRSYSVGLGKIGRIEEDRPCSFREDDNDGIPNLYPRSRSHAIRRKL